MFRPPVVSAPLLAETVAGLFESEVMLPPVLRVLCTLLANVVHVELPLVVAHILPVAQALTGAHYVSNATYPAMVCGFLTCRWHSVLYWGNSAILCSPNPQFSLTRTSRNSARHVSHEVLQRSFPACLRRTFLCTLPASAKWTHTRVNCSCALLQRCRKLLRSCLFASYRT